MGLQEIFEGWKNYTFPNSDVENIAKKRITICLKNDCSKLTKNHRCGVCGCYVPAKVRSIKSKCPLNLW